MDDALAFFLFALGAAFLALPIVGAGVAWSARKSAARAQANLDDLRLRTDAMDRRIFELERWIAFLSHAPAIQPPPRSVTTSEGPTSQAVSADTASGTEQPTEAKPVEAETHDQGHPLHELEATHPPTEAPALPTAGPTALSTEAAPSPPPTPSNKGAFDWEGVIGVRFFAWLGGAALFIGAALFLQYSIQHNLIAPEMRVAIGLVAGALALAGGDYVRTRADRAGQALAGAGVAILYASLFAARSLYHLLDTLPTFAAMAAVTVVAGIMAVRRDAYMLALLGLLGGMATPYLLSTGEDRPFALLAYVILLDTGVLLVARKRSWPSLGLMGFVGSGVIYLGWALHFLDSGKLPFALVAAGAVASLFAFSTPQEGTDSQRPVGLARATAIAAGAAPLVLSLIVAGTQHLAVSPSILVPYLIVVSAGAWITSRRAEAPPLVPIAAGLSSIALVLRVDNDLFPAHRVGTLCLFALVPTAFFAHWLFRRASAEASIALPSAVVTLASSLLILLRILGTEGGGESIAPLCLFVLAHVAGLAAMGVLTGKGVLLVSAQAVSIGTLLILLSTYSRARFAEFLPAVTAPMVTFWALPWLGTRFTRDRAMWLSSAAALVAHFAILYPIAQPVWGDLPLGAMAVACGLCALLTLRRARTALPADSKERLLVSAAFGATTLLFVTAAVPILVNNEWITVAWGVEAAALAWLLRRIPHRGLFYASIALAGATFVRLVLNPVVWEYHARSSTPILNFYLYTFSVPALSFFAAAHWLERERPLRGIRTSPVLRGGALVLWFVLLNVEIADYYSTGTSITFRFSGGGLSQDMTYSLAWGIFAIALLAFGIARKAKPPRIGALVVLILTIGKVFLHDLWELGALYRVGSTVGLAVALLVVSFLTQRFVLRSEAP